MSEPSKLICSICMNSLNSIDNLGANSKENNFSTATLPSCGHVFHYGCLKLNFLLKPECPVCGESEDKIDNIVQLNYTRARDQSTFKARSSSVDSIKKTQDLEKIIEKVISKNELLEEENNKLVIVLNRYSENSRNMEKNISKLEVEKLIAKDRVNKLAKSCDEYEEKIHYLKKQYRILLGDYEKVAQSKKKLEKNIANDFNNNQRITKSRHESIS